MGIQLNGTSGTDTISAIDGTLTVDGVITATDKLSVGAAVTSNVSGINVTGVVTATSFSGSGANLTGITGTTINNQADNRLITCTGTSNTINGEANLTFDGTQLSVTGSGTPPVYIGGANPGIKFEDTNASGTPLSYIYASDGQLSLRADDGNETGSSHIEFKVDGSEKLRIDSSGNVLIGTTDSTVYSNSSGEGIVLRGGDVIDVARSGDLQLTLNRQSNDGPHIAFYRDGAVKSYISTRSNAFCIDTGGLNERLRIDNTGRLLLGPGAISLPKGSAAGSLDLDNGNITMCIGGNQNSTGRTNSTDKINRITSPHYTNAEEPVALISSYNTSSQNLISYGGGSSQTNAATEHGFYVGGNTNSTTGALKFKIDTNGYSTFYGQLNVANYIRTNAHQSGGAHMYFKNNSQGANYSSHFQTYLSSNEGGTTQTHIHYYHGGYCELLHQGTSVIRTLSNGVQIRNGGSVSGEFTNSGLTVSGTGNLTVYSDRFFMPVFHAYNVANTGAVSGWKNIDWNNRSLDSCSGWDASNLNWKPNKAGYYLITFSHAHTGGHHTEYEIEIKVGGNVYGNASSKTDRISCACLAYMNGSSHVCEWKVYHSNNSHACDNGDRRISCVAYRLSGVT